MWHLDWARARSLRLTPAELRAKRQAVNAYLTPAAPCGRPYSGVLPSLLPSATTVATELYFLTPSPSTEL